MTRAAFEWVGFGVNHLYSLTGAVRDGHQYLSRDSEVYPETDFVVGCYECMLNQEHGDFGKGHKPAFLCGAGHYPYDANANYFCQDCSINLGIFERLEDHWVFNILQQDQSK